MEIMNFSFKVSALIFLAIFICVSLGKQYINILQNKMYRNMVWTFLLVNFFDIILVTISLSNAEIPIPLMQLFYFMYYLMYLVAPEVFLIYVLSVMNQQRLFINKYHLILKSTAIIYVIILLTNPITGWIYTIGQDSSFVQGPYHFIMHGIIGYHVIVTFILILKGKGKSKDRDSRVCLLVIAIMVIATLIQQFVLPKEFIITPLVQIVIVMLIQFMVQAPEYYIHKDTGLFNEVGLTKMIAELGIQKNEQVVLAICFKEISSSNRAVILKYVRKELRKYIVRKSKQTCYLAGNEMYILCDSEKKADYVVTMLADRMKEAFVISGEEFIVESKILYINKIYLLHGAEDIFSITSFFKKHIEEFGEVAYYDMDLMQQYKRRETIKQMLTEAIRTDGIKMYYQPIYSVERNCLDTAECLVRLKDEVTLGFVSPEEFIPIAEEENLILPLEALIFENVCRFVQAEQLYTKNVKYIDINLSGKQCKERTLSNKLLSVIKKCNIPTDFINIEITETSAVTTNQRLIYNMEKLGDVGISFSLDDFGHAYSNLKNLSKLPFDVVKLDKSLVWSYFEDDKGKIILQNVITMLQQLGTYVLAEGVETKEQKDVLIDMGVIYLQGYYFSRPVPEGEYLTILENQQDILAKV